MENRRNFLLREFEKRGASAISFASDGDSKYLKSMKNLLNFGVLNEVFGFLSPCNQNSTDIFFQDPPHKVNNLKNRMFDVGINMYMGTHLVTIRHIQHLVKNRPKNEHLISESDVNSEDRMNFEVVEKISTPKVLELLELHVVDSVGTVTYIKLMRLILDAFVKRDLTHQDRITKAFTVLFFLRIWRSFVLQENDMDFANFVSYESFVSIEINCWCLIKLILLCRDDIGSEFFLIFLCNSQICEYFFRKLRSMTSTFSTKVNFTPYDTLNRIFKLNIMEEITIDLKEFVAFRSKLSSKTEIHNKTTPALPSNVQIEEYLLEAENTAQEMAKQLGMIVTNVNVEKLYSKTNQKKVAEAAKNFLEIPPENDCCEEISETCPDSTINFRNELKLVQDSSNNLTEIQNLNFIQENTGKTFENF